MKHNNDRRYKCPQCPKAFFTPVNLREHIYSHTGERPFACALCGLTYTSKGSMYTHMRIKHKNVRCKLLSRTKLGENDQPQCKSGLGGGEIPSRSARLEFLQRLKQRVPFCTIELVVKVLLNKGRKAPSVLFVEFNAYGRNHLHESHSSDDFKPASVDTSRMATMRLSEGNKVSIQVPHIEQGEMSTYKGSRQPATSKECVLIIDRETGKITLEKLTEKIQVKKTRAEVPSVSPPQVGLVASNDRRPVQRPLPAPVPMEDDSGPGLAHAPGRARVNKPKASPHRKSRDERNKSSSLGKRFVSKRRVYRWLQRKGLLLYIKGNQQQNSPIRKPGPLSSKPGPLKTSPTVAAAAPILTEDLQLSESSDGDDFD
ncbi:unnamed protein product [Cyprideis torosa]|uniref:Ell-associated factor Eaf n=1 Tax=Cyprideis torosa TaxID=163714 RepID=A0A7R8WI08_9CRUS|nr:unnamed protein product [Cyprideis torosa]CAG0900116.1 unnamed protein product [Cyprideis torosa]